MMAATSKTIDITPTWRGILPLLLAIHSDATTAKARKDAFDELGRMADLADAYVAEHKDAK